MNAYSAINAIVTRLHERAHQGTCADMHPLIHAQHMRGFRRKAQLIHERNTHVQ